MRRYLFEVSGLAVYKRNSKLPSVFQTKLLESGIATRFSSLRAGFFNRKHSANVFIAVEEVKFLRDMA